jgi:peptidoglycan-associated lipoprotein
MSAIDRSLRGLALALMALAAGCATAPKLQRSSIEQAPPVCQKFTVSIYFEPDSDQLTDEGRAVISQAAGTAQGCQVDQIEVLGLADAAGAPGANLALSQRRAETVTLALTRVGLPTQALQVAAAGQAGSVTPAGETRPLRRRADIVMSLSAPPPAPPAKPAK